MSTRKLTLEGLCLAMALILPQMFHLLGLAQAGQVFLPMHIPVLIGGMTLGWKYGALLGLSAPLFGCLLTGMPSADRVPMMMVELMSYGFISGYIYQSKYMQHQPWKGYISVIAAMLLGRIVYGSALVFGTMLLGVPLGGFFVVWTAAITGIPGLIIQLIFVPVLTRMIEKGGYLYEPCTATLHSK